jgi:phage-related protein
MSDQKEIRWMGTSFDDLLRFPAGARRVAGFQLGKIQAGHDPSDCKAFDEVGAGTKEIRLSDSDGAYRVMFA